MKKRLISLLVALCMAVTLLPVSALTAWAEESSSNSTTLRIKYGYPVGSGENHDQDCSGEGWSYDGTTKTLKLNPTSPTEYDFSSLSSDGNTLDCALEIGAKATITSGSFTNDITNHGIVSGGTFSPIESVKPRLTFANYGIITDGTFYAPVNTPSTSFELSNYPSGTIEGGNFRNSSSNFSFSNQGSINGGVFGTAPDNTLKSGYILNCAGDFNFVFYATCYVIPNTNSAYPTKITASFSLGVMSPFDVTINNTQQMLLTEWAGKVESSSDPDGLYVTFTAPPATADTVTLSKLTRLVIDKDGFPVGPMGSNKKYSGNGWKFENGTLTLESGDYSFWEQPEVKCPVIIKNGVTTIGGMFSKVTNYGTVEKAVINNIFENHNTVKNSYFFNFLSSIAVTNHGGTMLDCLFENEPKGIESHTITEVEDYFISAELDGIAYQAIQTKFYFTGTPKLRVNLVKNGNVKPVTSINQKLNYGELIEDYPVGYIFTVENDNEDVVLNAAPVPGKDDPKPDPKPEPKPEPEPEAPTYTLTVKGGTFTYNGGEAMTSASVPVDAEVKVTLNQSAVPEGMVFDLWAMDEASLLGNPAVAYNEESFTIPAGSVAKGSTVTVEAQYRDATIESEPSILGTAAIIGVAGAGTAVIVWQGYRIGMELYEKYFQPTPEETAAEQPAPEAPAAAAAS